MEKPILQVNEDNKAEANALLDKIINNCQTMQACLKELNSDIGSLNSLRCPFEIPSED